MLRLFLLVVLFTLSAAAAAWEASAPHPAYTAREAAVLQGPGDAARGRIVFVAADCASCHASPGQSDRLYLGGGLALGSPMGIFRVPNISPDPVDGIGAWSTVDLANAIMSGVSPDGRHYYPALPYTSYARMRPQDVRDLMAYLRALPPVHGKAPPHELPFPFNIRRSVGLWKLLFFHPGPVSSDVPLDDPWSRGRYLVETVGHCAECHSTHNMLGAVEPSSRLAGGPDVGGVGFVPDITPAHLARWSVQDIEKFLHSGRTPDLRSVGSTMADVIVNTAALPAEDRHAIAVYLKSLPPKDSRNRSS